MKWKLYIIVVLISLRFPLKVVELPMLHPEKFVKLGIDPPKGVLCYGPPGTGKTLLARAVANRTDACFIRVIGSELVQKYVGEGARMVRELFQVLFQIFSTFLCQIFFFCILYPVCLTFLIICLLF